MSAFAYKLPFRDRRNRRRDRQQAANSGHSWVRTNVRYNSPVRKKTKSTHGELSGGRFEIEPRFNGDKRQDRVHRERYREIRKPGKRDNRLAFSLFELTKQHPGILIGWLL